MAEQEVAYNVSISEGNNIFTAEAMAIKLALGYIIGTKVKEDVLILTDSQSVCKRIISNRIERNQNNNIVTIRERIEMYINNIKKIENRQATIVIGQISGHKGIRSNEIAGKLAKDASEEVADIRIKVPSKDWHFKFKEDMKMRTKRRIEAEGKSKGKKFFELYYNSDKKNTWFKKFDTERDLCTMINRLRTNHYNLKESLERKGYIDDAMYECGIRTQDIYHVVFECKLLEEARNKIYRELQQQEEKYPYDLDNQLKYIRLGPLAAVWRLLKGGFSIQ